MRTIVLKNISADSISDLLEIMKNMGYFQSRDYGMNMIGFILSTGHNNKIGDLPVDIYNEHILKDPIVRELFLEYLV